VVAIVLPLVVAAARDARAVTAPTIVLGRNRVGEFQGVKGDRFIAWQQNSRKRPGHYDVLARPLGGGETFRVNGRGTNGANGSIDGDVLVYQQFAGRDSDLKLFDLADRTRSSPPRDVNTRKWEYWPSMSGDHLFFGRLDPRGHRRIILFDVSSGRQTTLAGTKGPDTFLAPGQVSGDYAVWSKCPSRGRCDVFLYRISDGTRQRIPNQGGRDHAPSVTPDGTVYFARSGSRCGSSTRLVRYLPGGPATTLWRLPSGDDVGTTRVHQGPGGPATVYYDHFACGRPSVSDVWEIAEEGSNQLSVSIEGNGSGTVTSSPPGIDCGSDCREVYAPGTGVTLTATPSGNATFAGWSGACSGTATTCTLTMDGPRSVTATFTKKPVLTVTKAGSGNGTVTSSPAGIDCGPDCSEPYDEGTTVTLTANPDATSTFAGWSGACNGTGSCTVTMNASKSVTATFDAEDQGLTVTVAGGGSVASTPAGISCPGTCVATFAPGTMVTLTASPDPPNSISWSGDCSGTDPTCVVTMNGPRAVTATFQPSP
jgi:Divergent InlB B-repeat domain/WD40-like Beta Propeller Repeat